MKNLILKMVLCGSVICAARCFAQSVPITGDLAVSGGLKAGAASSTINAEFTQEGLFILKGEYGEVPPMTDLSSWAPRLIWHGGKGALRAGVFDNLSESYIGFNSAAFGDQAFAPGEASFATGNGAGAVGPYSMASGYWSWAAGFTSQASGIVTSAYGTAATAFGSSTSASGEFSLSAGSSSSAEGFSSVAFGSETKSRSYASVALGSINVGEGNPTAWIDSDPIFEVGNGKPSEWNGTGWTPIVPSNAMTVYKNGNVDLNGNVAVQGVITCAPGGDIPMFSGN